MLFFCSSYDLVFTDGPAAVLEKFLKFDARVVFSAEGFCWPDTKLAVSLFQIDAEFFDPNFIPTSSPQLV